MLNLEYGKFVVKRIAGCPDKLSNIAWQSGSCFVRKKGPGFPGSKQILWVKYLKRERGGNWPILAVTPESRKSL
eukprot:1183333-Prorocentrum_minimum.AAC.1